MMGFVKSCCLATWEVTELFLLRAWCGFSYGFGVFVGFGLALKVFV